MSLRYHDRNGRNTPDYVCQRARIEYHAPVCQVIPGTHLDDTIAEIVEAAVSRRTVDVAVAVEAEMDARSADAARLWRQRVERVRHEAEVARERYMCVDPRNRLVADSLERGWNEKLRELRTAEEEDGARSTRRPQDADARAKLVALVNDFPKVWNNPRISAADKKRIVRLVIEDVTLVRNKDQGELHAQIRFKGGATRSVQLNTPVIVYEKWKTKPDLLREIDRLLDDHAEGAVAEVLNQRGLTTSYGNPFRVENVAYLRKVHGMKPRRDRLRERGFRTCREMAQTLRVSMLEVERRAERGELETCRVTDHHHMMYRCRNDDRSSPNPVSADEVQYA
jgi:hypothetical protein